MNLTLWIGQVLLAAIFALSGALKSAQSRDRMIATGQTAAKIVPLPFMRLAGMTELAGVLGVVLPWATGVARVLTPVAAAGFAVVMVLAAAVHARLREPRAIATNAGIFVVAVLVSWGRFADL
jgi:drug/metabolite transporter superfamily protein YnfA